MPMPMPVAMTIWPTAPGITTAPYGHQIGHGEMQAHAEHQQHDTDLGQLSGYGAIGDEAGVKGLTATPATR